ncbi:MAG: TonB-dependent receptor, partial [Synergistaceae bacterium]|nr:TonB-dependent receptor [Synergistaceae bacterium]
MSVTTKSGRAFALSLLALMLLPSALRAAVDLPEEKVVASVIYDEEEDKYLSPGMVTVIRPEERKGEQRDLPHLLAEVPGLRVIRLQGRNGYSVASVRGSTSSQVAVYVDGVLMNLESEAAVDLSAISVDNVERVEVYRGYIPAKFGAQAMGGVINIVTKTGEKPKTELLLGAGSFGRWKGILSHSAPLGGGKFFASLGYETYDGDFEYWNDNGTPYNEADDYPARRLNNGFANTDLLLKWENEYWKAEASFVRRNRGLPAIAPGADKSNATKSAGSTLDTTRWNLFLGRSQVSGALSWNWKVTYTEQNKEYDSGGGNSSTIGGIGVSHSEYNTTRFGIELDANLAVGERHFLELLAGYSAETLDVKGDMIYQYLGGIDRYDVNGWNFAMQDTIALDAAGSFLLTPSIRWHEIDGEGHFTWQAALTKEFSPGFMLKTTYGTYARAPNMYERYGDGAFIIPSSSELKWETGRQFDIGAVWNGEAKALWDARVNVSLSAFWRETDDLIEFFMTDPKHGRYLNVARSEVKGVEFETGLDWEKWSFSLYGTWMDAVNKTPDEGSVRYNGMALPNRPEWSGGARLTRRFNRDRGSIFAEYQYIGENYVDSSEKVVFDARNIFNVGLKYELSPNTRLTVGVDDIFNSAYDWKMRPDGYNGPTRMLWYPVEGRSFYMTL